MKSMVRFFNLVRIIRNLSIVAIFVLGVVAIIGSNGSDGDGNDDGSQSITITGKSGNPVGLDGSWTRGCRESDGESEEYVTTIEGSSFTQVLNNYESVIDCSGSSDMIQTIKGTVILNGEKEAEFNGSPVTVGKFDGTFTSAQATIKTQSVVDDANAEIACGYNDWELGVAKDILDTDCFDSSKNFKAIIYIDDTADPDLWYDGDDDLPLDADGYPTVVDSESSNWRL